jgi:hypothetical protein
LYRIKDFFGCGNVTTRSNLKRSTRVTNFTHIQNIIIPHFNLYPLSTQNLHKNN